MSLFAAVLNTALDDARKGGVKSENARYFVNTSMAKEMCDVLEIDYGRYKTTYERIRSLRKNG